MWDLVVEIFRKLLPLLVILITFSCTSCTANAYLTNNKKLPQEDFNHVILSDENMNQCVKGTHIMVITVDGKEVVGKIREFKQYHWVKLNPTINTQIADNLFIEQIPWSNIEEMYLIYPRTNIANISLVVGAFVVVILYSYLRMIGLQGAAATGT